MAASPPDPAQDPAHALAACVRAQDPDRFFAALFAPAPVRSALFALYAFNYEVARVREVVSDPLPGEIRLQWWRDVLEGARPGDADSHPVAAALLEAVERYRLPRQALLDLIEARIFDLYDDAMPTLNDLEGYCGETASVLIQLAAICLMAGEDPGCAEASGHAGVAYAMTGLLRALPFLARRGQCYLPLDVLARHGLGREAVVEGRDSPALRAALAELRGRARHHLDRVRALAPTIPPTARPAFLSVALVRGYLDVMERPGYAPFADLVDRPLWRKQATLWWQARRARRAAYAPATASMPTA